MNKLLLVSVAFGEEYQGYAKRLAKIANVLELDCLITHPEGEPSTPLDAWRLKPDVMLEVWNNKRPVLFLDVDSAIHRSINELADLDCDLAAYSSRPGVWEDGVVLVQPTDKARAVLELWAQKCEKLRWGDPKERAFPGRWTNLALSEAIKELRPRVVNLQPQYCWNEFWAMADRFPGVEPVIQPNFKEAV